MHDELLHEVDEHDQVIGDRPRGELHRLGLRHRAVHILVFNEREELFLQKRSRLKDVNAGLWDTSAAGHVDLGESYAGCARRELREELGVDLADGPAFLFKVDASAETGWEFVEVYRAEHAGPFQLAPEEIEEGRWFTAAAVDAWVAGEGPELTSSFRRLWRMYRGLTTAP